MPTIQHACSEGMGMPANACHTGRLAFAESLCGRMLPQGHRPHAINYRLLQTAACYAATLDYFSGILHNFLHMKKLHAIRKVGAAHVSTVFEMIKK